MGIFYLETKLSALQTKTVSKIFDEEELNIQIKYIEKADDGYGGIGYRITIKKDVKEITEQYDYAMERYRTHTIKKSKLLASIILGQLSGNCGVGVLSMPKFDSKVTKVQRDKLMAFYLSLFEERHISLVIATSTTNYNPLGSNMTLELLERAGFDCVQKITNKKTDHKISLHTIEL